MRQEAGYYIWDHSDRGSQIGRHFLSHEFACQCVHPECKEQRVAVELVEKLDAVRDELGAPLTINSGFRCARHQAELLASGKFETVQKSTHELGHAADVAAGAAHTKLLVLLQKHFKAIGTAKTWAHVDLRSDKTRKWSYR